MLTRRKFAAILTLCLSLPAAPAAEPGGVASPKEATTQTDADWVDDRWSKTDIGQFLGATVDIPDGRVSKGIAIKVGDHDQATVCFDTDTLRYAAGWTGGFLKLHPQRYGLIAAPSPVGSIAFKNRTGPGAAMNGSFVDPRARKIGPLPRDWARYAGLYLHGQRVALSYRVGTLEVLESPWFEEIEGAPVFTRTIQVKGTGALVLRVADSGSKVGMKITAGQHEFLPADDGGTNLRIVSDGKSLATVSIGGASLKEPESLAAFTQGGPGRWLPELETRGVPGKTDGPIAIDTITIPYANPWNALFFTSGHDFLPNGEAAVCTIHGDVWLVSGLDRDLRNVKWKRFATGLYQPLGLKVVGGRIHVMERDQITVLHDLNGDRAADFYENFNNDCISTGGGHSYATSLETDSSGNFYFAKCSEDTPHGGTVLRVSASGDKLEVIATGFRNPNGLGIGPGDYLTVADQQGEWVPETRLDVIRPGGFYGYMPMHKRATAPVGFDSPLAWIPRAIDNSAGGQVWIPANSWGELGGQMLHLSYGRCSAMAVLRDEANNGANGGIVPLPGRFLSGAMRGRFNPADQALYVTGLRGWQTAAVKDGCLQRMRRTEAPLLSPTAFKVMKQEIELTFDRPLDKSLAGDPASYAAEEWNYRWTKQYGSADYSLKNKDKEGRDPRAIASATLSGERKVVLRFAEPLTPVNVLKLTYSLETTTGEEVRGAFCCTINHLP